MSGRKQDGLAVEHGAIERQRGDRVADARKGVRIVNSSAGPEADLLAIFAGDRPVAVELDFVQPGRPRRRPLGQRRLARQDEPGRLGT